MPTFVQLRKNIKRSIIAYNANISQFHEKTSQQTDVYDSFWSFHMFCNKYAFFFNLSQMQLISKKFSNSEIPEKIYKHLAEKRTC